MKDRLRQMVFRALRAKPRDIAGESYREMEDRQDIERLSFQGNCKHRYLSFKFRPLAVCADCQKTLRYMTDEETEWSKEHDSLTKVNKELEEFGVELKHHTLTAVERDEQERREKKAESGFRDELKEMDKESVKTGSHKEE